LLVQLSEDVVLNVLHCLDQPAMLALLATCRHFREQCRELAPSMKLWLFPHQARLLQPVGAVVAGALRSYCQPLACWAASSCILLLIHTYLNTQARLCLHCGLQRDAVLWMQRRERAQQTLPHPTICALQCLELGADADPFWLIQNTPADSGTHPAGASTANGRLLPPNGRTATSGSSGESASAFQLGLPVWVDTASGELRTEAPPTVRDSPGGLFCDEPGLGKTITSVG
jgi:hypothetical protein